MKTVLDKLGAIGSVLAAFATPCCLPAMASLGSAMGLTFMQRFSVHAPWLVQSLGLVALVGNAFAYRIHKRILPLVLSGSGVLLIVLAYNLTFNPPLIYGGMLLLVSAGATNMVLKKKAPCCRCNHIQQANG